MRRLTFFLGVVLAAGCDPKAPEPAAPDDFDFSGWPAATTEPYRVDPVVAVYCAAAVAPEEDRHGPHVRRAIVVRVSPAALDAFLARRPLAVGAVVVKEKHPDGEIGGPPPEYGAMVKREPGYDPANGDWEYRYVERKPALKVTQGRLENCIDCHRRATAQDYLFRTYLKPAGDGQ